MKVSISLGGSLLTRDQGAENYLKYARVLNQLREKGHKIVVVCGGGRPAREYISIARQMNASNDIQDKLGILATHMNAHLLIAALGRDADTRVHRRADDVRRHLDNKILVGGGHLPGSSTDYRAVLFARAMNADLVVNATDYGGIFDKDPRKHKDAKQYRSVTYQLLEKIIRERFEQTPGDYGLFDLKATKLAQRYSIRIVFIDGTDPEEILRAVDGTHRGTDVCDCGVF